MHAKKREPKKEKERNKIFRKKSFAIERRFIDLAHAPFFKKKKRKKKDATDGVFA